MNRTRKPVSLALLRRHLVAAAALIPVLLAVYFAAIWLRFDGQLDAQHWWLFTATVGFVLTVKVVLFSRQRVFQSWGRFVTFHDLVTLCKGASLSSLIVVLGDYFAYSELQIPRSVLCLDWALTIVFVGGLQMLSRFFVEGWLHGWVSHGKTPVLIVGANDGGEALLRVIRRDRKSAYRVVGFVAETSPTVGMQIGGVPVLGSLNETCGLAEELQVAEVFVSAGELTVSQIRKLVDEGIQHGVNVKVVPSYDQLLQGTVDLQPRPVAIDDLLRRDPVKLDVGQLQGWIDDRILLVTGSAGSIGSEICRQLLKFAPKKLVLVDQSENAQFYLERELRELAPNTDTEVVLGDVGDVRRMREIMRTNRPDIVFHAAAYKHVPLMEANPGEAVKNIALATHVLADLACELKVGSFVMISTDKAVNPTSVMGACKRAAELYVQALSAKSDCRFVTVRFGNVLDSAGSVVPIFREQIARGGPITVTHPEMRRYFMTIPEASQLVIQAGAMGQGGEVFVLDMGTPVKIVDLAEDIIRQSGLTVGQDVEIQYIGLRPGEKLYEELHANGERHLATSHPKILVAESPRHNLPAVLEVMQLLSVVADGSSETIVEALRRIVPEFTPEQGSSPPCRIAA
jgi:FlaA1/EpsC-like NDP-sugar epimerase